MEDSPPELVIVRLVDEHVVLTREDPRQRALSEFAATFAQQVRGGAPNNEVELDLGMPVRARSYISGHMPNQAPVKAGPDAQVLDHHKKR